MKTIFFLPCILAFLSSFCYAQIRPIKTTFNLSRVVMNQALRISDVDVFHMNDFPKIFVSWRTNQPVKSQLCYSESECSSVSDKNTKNHFHKAMLFDYDGVRVNQVITKTISENFGDSSVTVVIPQEIAQFQFGDVDASDVSSPGKFKVQVNTNVLSRLTACLKTSSGKVCSRHKFGKSAEFELTGVPNAENRFQVIAKVGPLRIRRNGRFTPS